MSWMVAKDLGSPIFGCKSCSLGMWNVTALVGKDSELVREVESFWLDIVGLAWLGL